MMDLYLWELDISIYLLVKGYILESSQFYSFFMKILFMISFDFHAIN